MIASKQIAFGKAGKGLSAKSYIQDGLVAMWDGIENAGWGVHDGSATVWKDLVGEREAVLNGSAYFNNNSVVLPSTLGYVSYDGVLLSNEYTVEIITLRDERYPSRFNAVFTCATDKFSLFTDFNTDNNWSFKQAYSSVRPAMLTNANKPLVILCTPDELYFRFQDSLSAFSTKLKKSGTFKSYEEIWLFGGNKGTHRVTGNLYRYAFYNRALTNAEIAHNYSIDKARFGL